MRAAGLPAWIDATRRAALRGRATDVYDLTPLVLDNLARARRRRPGHDRRRRHAVVLAGPGRTPACRSSRSPRRWTTTSRAPSTASASRPRSRGPRRRSTASGRRSAVARADRRLPDLRARRRVLGAVHGLRDLGALRHPRGALRPRRAGRAAGRGPRRQPEPLRLRDHRRGRDLAGRADDRRRRAPTRSGIATRPTSARRWRPSCGSGRGSRRSPRS